MIIYTHVCQNCGLDFDDSYKHKKCMKCKSTKLKINKKKVKVGR